METATTEDIKNRIEEYEESLRLRAKNVTRHLEQNSSENGRAVDAGLVAGYLVGADMLRELLEEL